jgi:hypothetical protein
MAQIEALAPSRHDDNIALAQRPRSEGRMPSDAEANDLTRVIDESGEDYLYPAKLFQRLALPAEVQRALQLAS